MDGAGVSVDDLIVRPHHNHSRKNGGYPYTRPQKKSDSPQKNAERSLCSRRLRVAKYQFRSRACVSRKAWSIKKSDKKDTPGPSRYRDWNKEGVANAFLAVFVTCLGLLGLASCTAEKRTREIGIRKVLGASVASIVHLLTRDFIKLVLIATFVAWPLAYLGVTRWLQSFAYQVPVGVDIFVLAACAALAAI